MDKLIIFVIIAASQIASHALKCWTCDYKYDDTADPIPKGVGDKNCIKDSTLSIEEHLTDCSEPAVGPYKGAHMYCYKEQVRSINKHDKYVSINRGCKFFPPEQDALCVDVLEQSTFQIPRYISGDFCMCNNTDKCNGRDFIPPEKILNCLGNCDLECYNCDYNDKYEKSSLRDIECSRTPDGPVLAHHATRCDERIIHSTSHLNDRNPKNVIYACHIMAFTHQNKSILRRQCAGLLIDKNNPQTPKFGCENTEMPAGYIITSYLCNTSSCNRDLNSTPSDCRWFQQIPKDESNDKNYNSFKWPPNSLSTSASLLVCSKNLIFTLGLCINIIFSLF